MIFKESIKNSKIIKAYELPSLLRGGPVKLPSPGEEIISATSNDEYISVIISNFIEDDMYEDNYERNEDIMIFR